MADGEKPLFQVRVAETQARPIVATSSATTTIRLLKPRTARAVSVGAAGFHDDGVVPLSTPPGPGLPSALDQVASVLRYTRRQPDEHLLVASHDPDAALAAGRAGTIHALLAGDRAAWVAACAQASARDWQELLRLAHAVRGWACDPGGVDGSPGPKTRAAMSTFRAQAGLAGGQADPGPDDWSAFLDVVQERLGKRVKALAAAQAAVARTTPAVVSCEAFWPLERVRARGYPAVGERRVDLLLFQPNDVPLLRCHTEGAPADWTTCDVFRKAKYTVEALPAEPRPLAHVLDVLDTHFNLESAVFLPERPAPVDAGGDPVPFDPTEQLWADLGADARLAEGELDLVAAFRDVHEPVGPTAVEAGLRALVETFRFHRAHPERSLVVAGHTDRSGSDAYNRPLSDARAAGIAALVRGERQAFIAACKAYSKPKDDVVILDYVARTRGWPCAPKPGAQQAGWAEVRAFQERYDADFGQSIAVDGSIGDQVRGAYFDIYQDDLASVLGGAERIAEDRARMTWVDPARPAVGCGESFPRVNPEVDGLREEQNRRVEVLFFEQDELPPAATGEAIYGGDYDFAPILGGKGGAGAGDGAFQHTTTPSSTPGPFDARLPDDPAPDATTPEEGWGYDERLSRHARPGWNELPPIEDLSGPAGGPFRFGVDARPDSPWSAPGATFTLTSRDGWITRTYAVQDGQPADAFRVLEFTEGQPGVLFDGVLRAGDDEVVAFSGCDIGRFVNPADDYDELPPDEGTSFQDDVVAPIPDDLPADFDPADEPDTALGELTDDGELTLGGAQNPFEVPEWSEPPAAAPGDPPPACDDPFGGVA